MIFFTWSSTTIILAYFFYIFDKEMVSSETNNNFRAKIEAFCQFGRSSFKSSLVSLWKLCKISRNCRLKKTCKDYNLRNSDSICNSALLGSFPFHSRKKEKARKGPQVQIDYVCVCVPGFVTTTWLVIFCRNLQLLSNTYYWRRPVEKQRITNMRKWQKTALTIWPKKHWRLTENSGACKYQ